MSRFLQRSLEFGDRLVFWGAACDCQGTLAFGTPDPNGLVPLAVDGGSPLYLEQYQVDPVLPQLDRLVSDR